jgi:hypothetical protein
MKIRCVLVGGGVAGTDEWGGWVMETMRERKKGRKREREYDNE